MLLHAVFSFLFLKTALLCPPDATRKARHVDFENCLDENVDTGLLRMDLDARVLFFLSIFRPKPPCSRSAYVLVFIRVKRQLSCVLESV